MHRCSQSAHLITGTTAQMYAQLAGGLCMPDLPTCPPDLKSCHAAYAFRGLLMLMCSDHNIIHVMQICSMHVSGGAQVGAATHCTPLDTNMSHKHAHCAQSAVPRMWYMLITAAQSPLCCKPGPCRQSAMEECARRLMSAPDVCREGLVTFSCIYFAI